MSPLARTDTPWPITDDGIWLEVRAARGVRPRPALFLDRDGVIIEDRDFVSDPAAVALLPGATRLIAVANAERHPVCVVTNQSGIDRDLYGWADFAPVQRRVDELLADNDARLDGVAACPFHPEATAGYGPAHARWRKPGPGMIEALAERLNVDLGRSWLVGDKPSDIEAAREAGLAGAIRLPRPHGDPDSTGPTPAGGPGFEVFDADGPDAARRLLEGRLPPSADRRA